MEANNIETYHLNIPELDEILKPYYVDYHNNYSILSESEKLNAEKNIESIKSAYLLGFKNGVNSVNDSPERRYTKESDFIEGHKIGFSDGYKDGYSDGYQNGYDYRKLINEK